MNYKTNYSMQLQQNHLNKSFKINGTNYRIENIQVGQAYSSLWKY